MELHTPKHPKPYDLSVISFSITDSHQVVLTSPFPSCPRLVIPKTRIVSTVSVGVSLVYVSVCGSLSVLVRSAVRCMFWCGGRTPETSRDAPPTTMSSSLLREGPSVLVDLQRFNEDSSRGTSHYSLSLSLSHSLARSTSLPLTLSVTRHGTQGKYLSRIEGRKHEDSKVKFLRRTQTFHLLYGVDPFRPVCRGLSWKDFRQEVPRVPGRDRNKKTTHEEGGGRP